VEAAHPLPPERLPPEKPAPEKPAPEKPARADVPPNELSDRDRRMLRFEQGWWRHPGAKEEAIRVEFGLSSTRYYQLLNRLIDSEAALIADPMLVRRLRRLREQRRAARSGRHDRAER
jgi:hypothetical protein